MLLIRYERNDVMYHVDAIIIILTLRATGIVCLKWTPVKSLFLCSWPSKVKCYIRFHFGDTNRLVVNVTNLEEAVVQECACEAPHPQEHARKFDPATLSSLPCNKQRRDNLRVFKMNYF